MRTALGQNSTLVLPIGTGTRAYIIDDMIGSGATCIVYSAHYKDHAGQRHRVHIKECYPYSAQITRSGNQICWAEENERDYALTKFRSTYQKLLEMQNTQGLRNATAHAFELCEANGTLYSVMNVNEGKTFEQDISSSLSDILKTVLALTRVVGKYHENGYLHLDIKPSNFLTIPETRELVILFDMDSVTSIEDIQSGQIRGIAYSKGWAAPEQMQGKLSRLCPATDLFAIGAILFEKVMGRQVSSEDMGIFADWEFSNPMFDAVNPRIKRILRGIFHHTLSANIQRRYQTTGELAAALEEAVRIADKGAPYLIAEAPISHIHFVGRQEELQQINRVFADGKKCVFLHGFGGIGKTELSRKFAEVYAKSFDCIVFLRHDEKHASIVDLLLEEINIANYDEDRNSSEFEKRKQRLKKIQELLTPETLIILDNYDVETPASELLDMFDWNVKWLVTTRSDFSYLGGQTAQIQVGQMAFPELLEIFQQESHQPVPSEQASALERLFAQFDNYTMVVTLLAKQVYAAGITIEELCGTDDVYAYDERLVSTKDAVVTQDTLLGHLQRVFNMAGLTDEQQETLRTVWMMQDANEITKQFFKKYSGLSLNSLNSLISLGWLQYADNAVSLHPVIKQLVEHILHPTCQNCPHLYQTFLQRLSALRTAIDQNDSDAFSGETENLFRVYAYYMFATDERADENLLTLSLCLLDLYEQYEAPEFMWFIGWENQEYFFPSILRTLSLAKSEEPEENMILEEKKLWYQPLTLHIANLGCNFCRMQFENLQDVESSSEDVLDNTVAVYSELLWAIIRYDHKTQQSAHHLVQRQVDQIIEIDNPTRKFSDSIFMKECSICENGDYHDWIECDYSRGISPHRNEWHWNFYVVLYMALSLCFEAYPKEERHAKRYQEYDQALNRMNAEILRAGVGYNHFYDFYNLSQGRANKLSKSAIKWDADKHFTHSNLNYFDENNTHAYFNEVVDTLQRTKQPYYLYRLLLNDDFRISYELKCLLIEWDMAKHIAEDPRLTNVQKRRLAVFAVKNVVPEGDFDSKRSILQRHCIDGILQNDTVPQKTKYGIYNAVANNFVSKVGEYYYEVITDGGTLPVDYLFHQYYPIHKNTPNTVALFADSIYQHINGWSIAISCSTAITAQMNYLSHTGIPHLCRTEAIYTHIQFSDALGGEEGFRTIMDKVVPVAFRYLMLPEHFDPGLVLSMVDIIKETEEKQFNGKFSYIATCPYCQNEFLSGTAVCPYCNRNIQ